MRPAHALRALFLGGLAAAAACHAGPRDAEVSATARDAGGRPVAGLYGRLVVDASDTTLEARTDSAGRVRWTVPAGGSGLVGFSRDSAGDYTRWTWTALLLQPGTNAFDVVTGDTAAAPDVRPADPGTASARWGRIMDQMRAVERRLYESYTADVAAGRKPDFHVDLGAWPDSLERIASADRSPEVRAAAWLALASTGSFGDPVPDSVYGAALEGIPPTALVWARRPTALREIARFAVVAETGTASQGTEDAAATAGRKALADHRADEYLLRVSEESPDSTARAWAMEERVALAKAAGRQEDARSIYQRLGERFPLSEAYRFARHAPPGVAVQAGSPVPDVPFPPFAPGADPIPPSRFAGKVWLVDFWATWCVPCVAEMPTLHRAYRDFHDRGFDIVSVSFDAKRSDVAAFREKWPMPWTQSFVAPDSAFASSLSRAYGVSGLPQTVLVGRDGKVIAVNDGLRGDELEKTLQRALGATAR